MFLSIDIGNTMISIAVVNHHSRNKSFQNKNLVIRQIPTTLEPTVLRTKLTQQLIALVKRYHCQHAMICSVVPLVGKVMQDILFKNLNIKPVLIGRDIIVPIKNLYRKPHQVGQDRLVCSYAAKMIYKEPLVVIDFGTAITFDVISQKGDYLGGIIVPGIRLTAESLFKKTALLPKVKIKAARELIGRDTSSSILSGIFYGYGALADGLIELISKEIHCTPKVIITGGYSHWMQKFISYKIFCVDRNLVFKGMSFLGQQYFL